MESLSPQVVAATKLPILNPNEFDLWKIRIKQYFLMTNYSLWEFILNGDSPVPTRIIEDVLQPVAPTTAEQRLARKNELKARGTLLMALPDKHQLKFNSHKDAKTLMEAIEKRFGGNTKTKKVQKTLLKQQFENFTGSNSKGTASQNLAFVSSTHTDSTTNSVSAAASVLGIKCFKAFPLLAIKIPLLEYFATKFRIQQYLQNEHYALWEVIEFGDSYKAPQEEATSESFVKKKGRTVFITTEDMQKRRNDVKARTTLLLALPDEHQLRFNKYEIAKELWEAILKTFGGNDATKKTKKNQLQAIVSHLEFMDVEIKQDDLNQKFLTSLTPEWLMYTIVWRNRDDLDTMSLDDVYNHLKVYEPEVQKKSETNSQNMAFISSANTSNRKGVVHTASVPTDSTQIKYEDIAYIDKDDIEEIDIKWNIALLSMRADRFWKKTGKNITIQGTDVAGFDKSKVECFNCHKMGHFTRECRVPRSQDRGRRESYKQGSKEEEPARKALMAIDGIGWDWSYMANEEENHALVADDEALTEFVVMAKSSSSSKNKVKKEKEGLDSKLTCFESASKDLDTLLGSHRTDKNKEGLGYNVVPPSCSTDSPTVIKTNKVKTARKSSVKYAEMYRNTSKSHKVRGNQRNWNNLKSQQLGKDFVMQNKAYFKRGHFDHLAYDCGVWVEKGKTWLKNNFAHKNVTPRSDLLKTGRTPIAGNSHNNIDDKGYWDSGCSRYMTGNISYLSEYEPYDGGYVSFGQGGGKITGKDFKLKDDTNVFLRTPRQHNIYSIDLNNIVPHKDLTCLVAKAFADESMLWHRRLGHLNFKTMNKLVRHNLIKGLPSKCFKDDHTCVAFLKGKQHKASCKTKLVNSVSKPLYTLHIDLFGPISVSSLNHKWYCLVVTDDFSRFTWTLFLRTKDETSGILRNFITEIENLKDLKVKIIRVLVNKTQNKTLYELFNSRTTAIEFLRPFGCHIMILNTLDHLRKFDAKRDEGKSSTNISGTKDVASQDVKKDVSSLRYIALPNWFHEAHMESSNSNAQDACNADVSESSGISNPTATSKIPAADQMESLTMESNSHYLEFLDRVYKVKKAMYRLHQAPRAWYGTLSKYLLANDFQRGTIDQTLFIRKHKGEFLLVQVYLGDIIFGSSNLQLCREFEYLMHDKFQMSAMGELTFFLGLRVLQKKDGIFLSQYKYIGDILKKSMIGTFMYLTASRPDIMFAVCNCARHQVTPKECLLHAVKRILRYLKGHPKLGLWYPEESPFDLVAYSDSDYSGATHDRKSTTGGCQFLAERLISWQCKKQTIVATSTTKAEYVATASGCGQVI
nr:hypothetical protein [Tanacetum cinerariifolium]